MEAKADAIFTKVVRAVVSNMPAPQLHGTKLSEECAAGA